jgi:hypothetical protein
MLATVHVADALLVAETGARTVDPTLVQLPLVSTQATVPVGTPGDALPFTVAVKVDVPALNVTPTVGTVAALAGPEVTASELVATITKVAMTLSAPRVRNRPK